MLRNSAADTFYGRFTASKIRQLIRRAVRRIFGGQIFSGEFEFGDRRRLRGLMPVHAKMPISVTWDGVYLVTTVPFIP